MNKLAEAEKAMAHTLGNEVVQEIIMKYIKMAFSEGFISGLEDVYDFKDYWASSNIKRDMELYFGTAERTIPTRRR